MDFIERMMSISPDGGSGALEILLILAPVLLVVAANTLLRRSRASR